MKNILYSQMNSLGSALDSYLQNDNKALQNILRNATLFKFWGKVAGKKFENVSKPVSLSHKQDGAVLTVACANASVTNELMLYKNQLIKKLNIYANPLCIDIKEINFSHKIWQTENANSFENNTQIQTENPYKEDLSGFNPDEITIDEDEISSIKENISKNKALSKEQKERLLSSIIYDIKVRKYLDKSH